MHDRAPEFILAAGEPMARTESEPPYTPRSPNPVDLDVLDNTCRYGAKCLAVLAGVA